MSLLDEFNLVSHKGDSRWRTAGDDVQFMVVDRTLYLQPSNGREDWRNNFDFRAVKYNDGVDEYLVHEGFLRCWLSAKEVITQEAYNRIVGYSHGGALAVLAHKDYRNRFGLQPETHTFGGPRVLKTPDPYVRAKLSQVRRYLNKHDIVTQVPFCSMGFEHIGEKHVLPSKARWRDATRYDKLTWITGHTPSMYRGNLEEV